MTDVDDQTEQALNRAGASSAALVIAAMITLVLGFFIGIAIANNGSAEAGIGVIIGLFGISALLYGIAILINLLGALLLEVWRQGRKNPKRESISKEDFRER